MRGLRRVQGLRVIREQELLQETMEIWSPNLAPAKVARFLAAQVGKGNYLAIRAQVFADETVAALAEKIQRYEGGRQQP